MFASDVCDPMPDVATANALVASELLILEGLIEKSVPIKRRDMKTEDKLPAT